MTKLQYGEGWHETCVPQMSITVANTTVKNLSPLWIKMWYDWSEGCKGDSEQPAEQEWFEITSIKASDTITLTDNYGVMVLVSGGTELISILDESYIDRLTIKVIKELREVANE